MISKLTLEQWNKIVSSSGILFDIEDLLEVMYKKNVHCTKIKLKHVSKILDKYNLDKHDYIHIYTTIQNLYYDFIRRKNKHDKCDIKNVDDLIKCKSDKWYSVDLDFRLDTYKSIIICDGKRLEGHGSYNDLIKNTYPRAQILSSNVLDSENVLGIRSRHMLFAKKVGNNVIIEKNDGIKDFKKYFKEKCYIFDVIHNKIVLYI